jgi:FG-GAP-like repeat
MFPLRIVSVLIITLGAVEMSPQCAARIFLTGRNYPSGEYPVAAAVADFNNDGISDIASANGNDQNVSVFLGNSDGTFAPANNFKPGAGATEIASADLNGDGKADLVVTDGIRSGYVVLGNGDGTFGSATAIPLHNDPIGIAIADLNGDGILDLAIAIFGPSNNSQGEAAILMGVGDGTFAAPVYYALTHNGLRLVAIDLNHDGKLDLAVAVQHFSNEKNALAVLLGNGDGTFQAAVTSVPGSANDIAAADFNGDGNVDLALADGTVQVVLGNGDGTFQSPTSYSPGGSTLATADLNHDGVPDLLAGGYNTVIFLGNGDGTFAPPALYGVGNRFARIGYFNGDGDPDVVAGGGFSEIGVAFGRADGTLRAPRAFTGGITGFDSGDFDGDGNADLVDGVPLSFLRGLGDGTFAPAVPIGDLDVGQIRAADFNGDSKLDFIARYGNGIDTFLGNGDGTFQAALFTDVGFIPWPVVADFNNDGQLDVAATDLSGQLAILLGKGDGTFEPPIFYQTLEFAQSPTVADFNLDGNPDLAISHTFDGKVSIFLGHGDGTFDLPLTITSRGALYLGAGDVNRDGKPDLVVGGGNFLDLFLGNGDGTFQEPQTIYSNYGPVEVADLDRDGRLDIIVSPFNGKIVVLRGKGDGTFGAGAEYPIGNQFSGDFVLSDLNGDAKPEAIVSNINDSLIVLRNISRPRR